MSEKYEALANELSEHSRTGKPLSDKALEEFCEICSITDEDELKIMRLINQNKSPEETIEILLARKNI